MVERYLEDFKRVSLLVMKSSDEVAIGREANLATAPTAAREWLN